MLADDEQQPLIIALVLSPLRSRIAWTQTRSFPFLKSAFAYVDQSRLI